MVTTFNMCFLINVERECQLTVPLQSGALFVARQRLCEVTLTCLRCVASHLLLLSLALTSDEDLVGAGLVFFASSRSVTDGFVWVLANLFGLSAGLLARSTSSIFTLAVAMTRFSAEVRATLELSATDLSTADVLQPTLLVLETLLAAHTALFDKERAPRTALIVHMTIVLDLRMTACLGTITLEAAWRRLSATRERRCQNSTATIAVNFVKNGLATRSARAFVAEIFAEVVATFERSTTRTSTNMLSLEAVIDRSNMSFLKLTALALDGLSFGSLSLAFAATLVTGVAATVESSSADSHTLRGLNVALMADCS